MRHYTSSWVTQDLYHSMQEDIALTLQKVKWERSAWMSEPQGRTPNLCAASKSRLANIISVHTTTAKPPTLGIANHWFENICHCINDLSYYYVQGHALPKFAELVLAKEQQPLKEANTPATGQSFCYEEERYNHWLTLQGVGQASAASISANKYPGYRGIPNLSVNY